VRRAAPAPCLLLISGLLAALVLPCTGADERPALQGVATDTPPVIDGDVSDACWQKAASVGDFYHLPTGTPATEATTAWICYDQENIYAAFYCKDSQPDKIQAQQTKRGGSTYTDDTVWLGIDCRARGNHIAWFWVSAGGVQNEEFSWADVSKIEWRGDWQAAAKRVSDGYAVEMAIPFGILQYSDKQDCMGILFERDHARLRQDWRAPNIGPTGGSEKWYLWEGLKLPKPDVKPKLMAYSVASMGGDQDSRRMGLDMKHSVTPSLTGLVTLNPYFDDIEQEVAGVDFTYNERYLQDSRPFFQEGEGFFPLENVLYTRRIKDVDLGAKLYGKMGDYDLAFMNVRRFGEEDHTVLQVGHTWEGNKANLWLCGVESDVPEVNNTVWLVSTGVTISERENRKTWAHTHLITADSASGTGTGSEFAWGITSSGGPKRLQWGLDYNRIDSDFDPYLGYIPEKDLSSYGHYLGVYDQPSEGALSYWNVSLSGDLTDHLDGPLYHNSIGLFGDCSWRNGTGVGVGLRASHRPPYHDKTANLWFWWGNNDLYNWGYADVTFGRQAGGDYFSYVISRGWRLGEDFSLYTGYEHSRLKPPSPNAYSAGQLIATLAYDLDRERTLGGRLVTRGGKSNFYLTYRQRVRVGTDAYLIFGDPNAESTRSSFALKLVRLL
jgi:hypothetical protein